MRWAALALALGGCNQLFDLREVAHVDAAPVAIDARITCPPIGTAPRFSPAVTQVLVHPCLGYSISTSARLALAWCGSVFEGPLDEPMAAARGFEPPTGWTFEGLQLAPEGDVAFARLIDGVFTNYRFAEYARAPDGTWTFSGDLGIGGGYGLSLSPPSSKPARHVMRYDGDIYLYDELVEQTDGSWSLAGTYTMGDLDVAAMLAPTLSPDARRMVFWGRTPVTYEDRLHYVDRPEPSARFGKAVPLEAPPVYDAVLTADCNRLYFTALESVFYMEAVTP